MSRRVVAMSQSDVAARAEHARAFLAAADLILDLGGDAGIVSRSNLVGSLAVLAGIAAADAMCGNALGERAAGEDHLEAVALLRRGSGSGDSSAAQLKRLLSAKTTVQYSPALLGDAKADKLLSLARRLVDTMESKL